MLTSVHMLIEFRSFSIFLFSLIVYVVVVVVFKSNLEILPIHRNIKRAKHGLFKMLLCSWTWWRAGDIADSSSSLISSTVRLSVQWEDTLQQLFCADKLPAYFIANVYHVRFCKGLSITNIPDELTFWSMLQKHCLDRYYTCNDAAGKKNDEHKIHHFG